MKNTDPLLRALYIVLVPVVLLIILLNSGFLQKHLPAVTVDGEKYTVVRYNYYYFDYYNSFLEENEDRLDELGYDPDTEDTKQYYDGDTTWKEFFRAEAEASLAETAYYYGLAVQTGYAFSEDELAAVEEKLAENEADQLLNGISAANYYVSFYGSGMTEASYTEELTRQVKARAYQAYLTAAYEPDQEDVDRWLAENGVSDYEAAVLRVITLTATPDRETGEVGDDQLAALEAKLGRLAARYEAGYTFDELQQSFSTQTLGDKYGVLEVVAGQVPQGLYDWCVTGGDKLSVGDTAAVVDRETGTACFAVYDGMGGSGAQLEAQAALSARAMEADRQQILEKYTVVYSKLGMMLVTA